ncbi:MAG: hypothetical protein H7067_16200 [Burkholderiales bacterium]|nr:hypothetical protein [Opitutaceae bacterium]
MNESPTTPATISDSKHGFCIYLNTFFQGPSVSVREGDGWPCVFPTEREAQLEIIDSLMIRLRQFIEGERDYEDAVSVEEYVVAVTVLPDGSVVDEFGHRSGKES